MTKKELEFQIHIYKRMYEKAHEERMRYYYILHSLANRFFYVAKIETKELENKEYILTEEDDGITLKELQNLIEELLKRGV